MEASLRGELEILIDELTSEKGLDNAFGIIREFRPHAKSEKDAVFGFILGLAMSNVVAYYTINYHRSPTYSEVANFRAMILERSYTIISKINLFSKL